MNWIEKIRDVLGHFWTDVFTTSDFITGLENLLVLAGKTEQQDVRSAVAGRSIDNPGSRFSVRLPFPLYIAADSVGRLGATYADIINGNSSLGADSQDTGYVCHTTYTIPEPWQITDHVVDYNRTLVRGFDYDFLDGTIVMRVDPSTLNLPTVRMTDDTGALKVYYRLFGWLDPSSALNDAVNAFEGPILADAATAAIVWDIHQNGASVKNIKKLLGSVTDSVICDNAGTITAYWTEQGRHYLCVGDRIYGAPASVARAYVPNTQRVWAVGDAVKDGDVLFGSLVFFSGDSDPSAAYIPSIRVRTDAGELKAGNSTQSCVQRSGVNILPLSGDAAVLSSYRDNCVALASDINCPRIDVPATVNPLLFIVRKLRRGRSMFASIEAKDVERVHAALACIRRSMCASGILDTYVHAVGDTLLVESSFTATAGNAAVSEDATVTVQNMLASATGGI